MATTMNLHEYDVVMFKEDHKWFGCLGYITEVKSWGGYMVSVPIPEGGTAYIICEPDDVEFIGWYPLREVDAIDADAN